MTGERNARRVCVDVMYLILYNAINSSFINFCSMQITEKKEPDMEKQHEIFYQISSSSYRAYGFKMIANFLVAIFFLLSGILFNDERWREVCFALGAICLIRGFIIGDATTPAVKKAKKLLQEKKLFWQSFLDGKSS
jgi:hypothetical protein